MAEELPSAAAKIPSNCDDLIRARDGANEILTAKIARYSRLKWKYYLELERHLKDPSHSRLEFDTQFCEDRGQAKNEITIATGHVRHFETRLKREDQLPLQDHTSDFGDISDDGRVDTMGTELMRDRRRREELERSYIDEYVDKSYNHIAANDLRNPHRPLTNFDEEHDEEGEARSVALGDLDTYSRSGDPGNRAKYASGVWQWRKSGRTC